MMLPLLSQPILELCLRIPVYVLRDGGQDRALARAAFADVLPPEILSRTSKGNTHSHMHEVFENNLPLIREILPGGYLVTEGFIDGATLEDLLNQHRAAEPYMVEILDYVCVESWARSA
jgi:asparagine synthase (glutamine-hydrolysing)